MYAYSCVLHADAIYLGNKVRVFASAFIFLNNINGTAFDMCSLLSVAASVSLMMQ